MQIMDKKRLKSCEVKLTVPFHDLDPMHMVWHANYLKYFDIARFELFDQAGIDLYEYFKKTKLLFPITKTSTKHIVALRHRDEFICKATITDARIIISMNFEIRRVLDNAVCARGKSDQVAVKYPKMEMMFEIPEDIRTALGF